MASAALREKQAPIKEQYKSDPSSAIVTLSSKGTLDSSSITCKLETGKAINEAKQKVAGLHQKAGGDDPEISGELCSGDMLLEALVACAGVTLKAVATALDIPIAKGTVTAEGDLDFKGTMGVDREAPVGFTEIRLMFDLQLEQGQKVEEEKIEKLGKLTERYCVVLQTITKKPQVKVHLLGRQERERGVDEYLQWSHRA
ncbi:OsmC/Ohr family [Neohortaea acidophila]|uniref:OsmC/Ohr family n=1 Tax=Neohortaea acidophila TaxID=245834 RepID=A0A6A6PZ17_9PEZI|nr:OsmC/Ohr family [Neohortaea acidophila]KAF2484991.1 OsmC/Ohr family [Neohortaea acidophila]